MASKPKVQYLCEICKEISSKWHGQCPSCLSWGSLVEGNSPSTHKAADRHWVKSEAPQPLLEVATPKPTQRQSTGISELDRVLGGGMTQGSCILLGGDPGIGKSTILLQMLGSFPLRQRSLYLSGEESPDQLGMRAARLGLKDKDCYVMSETRLDAIMEAMLELQPKVVVIDSIQTIYDEKIQSASGSVSQIRDCTHALIRFCKQRNITLFVIGHVTKEGALAGPRVLEHMVDTVLYFEGERSSRHRLIRAVKNRFGPANEIGIFAMTQEGLKGISNPSRMFLQDGPLTSGRVITSLWEGTRAMLIEIQVLVSPTYGDHPRRVAVGFDIGRLNMLLAVASRYLKLRLHEFDIFINVVGGIKITETSADLALLAALLSSHNDLVLPTTLMVFGEVGLGGEIRPVVEGVTRIQAASKQGFTTIWCPARNQAPGSNTIGMEHIQALNQALLSLSKRDSFRKKSDKPNTTTTS